MELKWFDVFGDIGSLNENIFDTLRDSGISLGKKIKIKDRTIFLNKETGFIHAIIKVEC